MIDIPTGPEVRPSSHLHWHECIHCRHSWSCISSTCLVIHDVTQPSMNTDVVMGKLRLPDTCRRCQKPPK